MTSPVTSTPPRTVCRIVMTVQIGPHGNPHQPNSSECRICVPPTRHAASPGLTSVGSLARLNETISHDSQ